MCITVRELWVSFASHIIGRNTYLSIIVYDLSGFNSFSKKLAKGEGIAQNISDRIVWQ